MMIKLKGIHHLGLPVNDMDRATRFYTEVLGMKCLNVDVDVDTGELYKEVHGKYPLLGRFVIENGGGELVLFQRPKPIERGDFDDGTAHVSFELAKEDFAAAVADLKKAGVKIMYEDSSRPSGRSVYFFDTEGNYIQIHTPL